MPQQSMQISDAKNAPAKQEKPEPEHAAAEHDLSMPQQSMI